MDSEFWLAISHNTCLSIGYSALCLISFSFCQYLVIDCKLMQCHEQKVLCSSFKKFEMEGCRIISNIGARSEILIEDMDKAALTHLLSNLLEADESDVKMEAAWAMFNMKTLTIKIT